MIKELDVVIATLDISSSIQKNTIGTVLSISKDRKTYLVEFVDANKQTIGDGMTVVGQNQIKLFEEFKYK